VSRISIVPASRLPKESGRKKAVDSDGQLTFEDDPDALLMKAAVNHLRLGDFTQAGAALEGIFERNPEYADIDTSIKACRFWENRAEWITNGQAGLEKGKFLKEEWNSFEDFIGSDARIDSLPATQAIRMFIFTEAIHSFTRAWENTISPDAGLLHDIGECYFNIRDLGHAVQTFEYAWELKRDSSRILARLADCYAVLGEERDWQKKSLLYFREAFLHNPREIELKRLVSPVIRSLAYEIGQAGFTGEEVACWIPIFAAFGNYFSIRRELEEYEVAMLQDQAYRLEGELRKSGSDKRILLPLLLNRYICLLDYFLLQANDAIKAELVRKRFIEADREIYEKIYSTPCSPQVVSS
jgi:tetratricopeptide (TPR) repeat protein